VDALCFGFRTGYQWGALEATGIGSHRAAHRRFQASTAADVFVVLGE
jgi:hypothetical protein